MAVYNTYINTEKTHDRHAKCPSQFRGMSVINPVNVGQNVPYFKKVFIYTDMEEKAYYKVFDKVLNALEMS